MSHVSDRLALAAVLLFGASGACVPAHAQDAGVPPQLQTDGQRAGAGDSPQIQSDNARRASKEQAMAAKAAQGNPGMMMMGAGYPGPGGGGYGDQGYGDPGDGMGASLGSAAAVDAVNAAAGVANRAILRGNSAPLTIGSDGVIRNDGGNGDSGGGYDRRGR